MKTIIIVLSILSLSLTKINAKTISGRVLDFNTGKPVSLVTITIKYQNKNETYLTDINGDFRIDLQDDIDRLFFSHLGYEPKEINIKRQKNKNIKIFLHLKSYLLDEVVVSEQKKITAKDIIKKVKANLNSSIINKSYQAKGYQKKYRKRNNKYVFFAEGLFDFYNSGYSKRGHSYAFTKPLQYRISDQELSYSSVDYPGIFPFSAGGYNNILIPISLNDSFTYSIADTLTSNNTTYLLINFKINIDAVRKVKKENPKFCFYTKHYQYGDILVNLDKYAPVQITCKGETLRPFHIKAEHITTYKFKHIHSYDILIKITSSYAYMEKSPFSDNYDSFLIKNETLFIDIDTTYLSNEQLEKRFNCKVRTDNYANISARLLSRLPAPHKKVSEYDSEYWATAKKTLDPQIKNDLKELAGIDIEQQFKNNSEYLIDETILKKMIKHSDKEMRKKLIRKYKEFKRLSFFK